MSFLKKPIQEIIEERVTNGLGYDSKPIKFKSMGLLSKLCSEEKIEEEIRKSKYFLKAHLTTLNYQLYNSHLNQITKVLEIAPKNFKIFMIHRKENKSIAFERKEMEKHKKWLYALTEDYKSSINYNLSLATSDTKLKILKTIITGKGDKILDFKFLAMLMYGLTYKPEHKNS